MKYPTRRACSIPLGDEVILTGGMDTLKTVSRYNEGGWVRDMSSLNTGRRNHGCTSYSTGPLEQVLLVTGGYDDDDNSIILDSTEVLRPGSDWQEITSARQPRPIAGVSVSTLDTRVLLFGGWYGEDIDRNDDILEAQSGVWRKVGKLTNRRSVTG